MSEHTQRRSGASWATLKCPSCQRAADTPTSALAAGVAADELREEIRNSMVEWEQRVQADPMRFRNRFHQVFFVLTNVRALQDLHESQVGASALPSTA